jgi:hypothetical protein
LSGCTSSSIAFWRPSRSSLAACWNSVSEVFASSRNDWLLLAQRLGRQRRERLAQLRLGVLEQRELLGRRAALGLELGGQPRRVLPRRLEVARRGRQGALGARQSRLGGRAARREPGRQRQRRRARQHADDDEDQGNVHDV